MKNEKPRVVKIHDVQIDSNYAQWLSEIKSRYRRDYREMPKKFSTFLTN